MTEHKGKRFETKDRGATHASPPKRAKRFKSPANQDVPSARPQSSQDIPEVVRTNEPFTVSPEVSGALPKLDAGKGAVITNRSNAASTTGSFPPIDENMIKASRRAQEKRKKQSRRRTSKKSISFIIGLVLALIAVIYIMFSSPAEDTLQQTPGQAPEQRVKVAQDGEVEFRGSIFSLSESKGTWELVSRPKSGEGDVRKYLTFEGKPVSLILYEGGFIIPEDLPNNTWDVVTYTVSDGSVVSKLLDSSGKPVGGSGKVTKAEVSGDNLNLTLDSGKTQSIKLK